MIISHPDLRDPTRGYLLWILFIYFLRNVNKCNSNDILQLEQTARRAVSDGVDGCRRAHLRIRRTSTLNPYATAPMGSPPNGGASSTRHSVSPALPLQSDPSLLLITTPTLSDLVVGCQVTRQRKVSARVLSAYLFNKAKPLKKEVSKKLWLQKMRGQ